MRFIIGKTAVTLDKSDVIGEGGEAVIFQLDRKAVKIYRDPTAQRGRKLRDFFKATFNLPNNVVAPLEPVFDTSDKLVGFTMRLLPSTHHPIAMLCSRSFCTNNNFGAKQIAKTFINMGQTLFIIHPQGLIVGDLNDQNEDFDPDGQDFWFDVDSWQFGSHPCMVGTESYLSPELYGIDLSRQPVFRTEHDWYSFCVLLFRSLLRVHPFRCLHPKYKSLMACAQHGVTVLDKGINYPRVGLPPEVLTDELADTLLRFLKRQTKESFPVDQLIQYHDILIQCKSCGIWYPANRSQCPGCAEKTIIDLRLATKIAGLICKDLIVTQGKIVFFETVGDTVYCLADEGGVAVMYKKSGGRNVVRKELFKITPGARYGIFEDMLVICPDLFAEQPQLIIVNSGSNGPKVFTTTTTEKLAGKNAVFACSGKHIYRLAGNMVMRSELFADGLTDREVIQAIPGQTWFTVSPHINNSEMLIGFYRIFGDYNWFLVNSNNDNFLRFDNLKLQPIATGESIIDLSIKFSTHSALIIRRTRKHGVDFICIDTVNGSTGDLLQSYRVKVTDVPEIYETIHGRAFANGLILHPTNQGIVRENTTNQQRNELIGTSSYLKADDQLQIFGPDLLIITDDRVMTIKQNK